MSKIYVELFDAATDTLLVATDLPIEQLPESFASMSLHLGGADWLVEHAEPMTRSEYIKTGRLMIRMRKIEHIDPNTILFSLPTIEDALPPLVPGAPAEVATLHADDWRQLELIAAAFEPAIAAELEAIRRIYSDERKGAGFAKLHIRKRIPQPFAGVRVGADDVHAALDSPRRQALVIRDGVVDGGFAFAVDNGVVYGRESEGVVVVLGFANCAPPTALIVLIRAHGLVLVDWCGAAVERFEA